MHVDFQATARPLGWGCLHCERSVEVKNPVTTVSAMLAVALVAPAFAQETTIRVPQGSGVFPTVGQVNCLEESGSGRLCAATYDCSGETGRLWGNLANHNGRRAINQDSPVARGRDCTITIDGRAAVRWWTAYAPRGRDSELVGLTTSTGALRPVVGSSTGEGGRSLWAYILERQNTTLAEFVESFYSVCDDRPFRERSDCIEVVAHGILDSLTTRRRADNAVNRCLVDTWESYCDWAYEEFRTTNSPFDPICHDNMTTTRFLLGFGPIPSEGSGVEYTWKIPFAVITNSLDQPGIGGRPNIRFENYNENVANFPCRNLAEQELSKMGIGVRYCGDGGRRWQNGEYVDCDSPGEFILTVLEQEQ